MLSRFPAILLVCLLSVVALKVAQIGYVKQQPFQHTAANQVDAIGGQQADSPQASTTESKQPQVAVQAPALEEPTAEQSVSADAASVVAVTQQNKPQPASAIEAITVASPEPSYQIVEMEKPVESADNSVALNEQADAKTVASAEVNTTEAAVEQANNKTAEQAAQPSAPVNKQQSIADALAAIRAQRAAQKAQAKQQADQLASRAIEGAPIKAIAERNSVDNLCKEVGDKLGSVNERDCLAVGMLDSGTDTIKGRALGFKHFPSEKSDALRVMLLGGIHGDEYSAVSIVFKWLKAQRPQQAKHIDWLVVPVSNPDGLLKEGDAQRMNGRGVDLNRNFPTVDWIVKAPRYWKWDGRSPRRYPGKKPASEPETQWYLDVIEEYQPDILVQVHAPIGLIDYDGPSLPPKRLGPLALNPLGTYPGSLGNYGASVLNVPVLTIELEHAGIMPEKADIDDIWHDMVAWIEKKHGNLPENTFTQRGGSGMKRAASAVSY